MSFIFGRSATMLGIKKNVDEGAASRAERCKGRARNSVDDESKRVKVLVEWREPGTAGGFYSLQGDAWIGE